MTRYPWAKVAVEGKLTDEKVKTFVEKLNVWAQYEELQIEFGLPKKKYTLQEGRKLIELIKTAEQFRKKRYDDMDKLLKDVSHKLGKVIGSVDVPYVGTMFYDSKKHLESIKIFSRIYSKAVKDGVIIIENGHLPQLRHVPDAETHDYDTLINIFFITFQKNNKIYIEHNEG